MAIFTEEMMINHHAVAKSQFQTNHLGSYELFLMGKAPLGMGVGRHRSSEWAIKVMATVGASYWLEGILKWRFPKSWYPKWSRLDGEWEIHENPTKMNELGIPHCREPPYLVYFGISLRFIAVGGPVSVSPDRCAQETICGIEGSVLSEMFSDEFLHEIPRYLGQHWGRNWDILHRYLNLTTWEMRLEKVCGMAQYGSSMFFWFKDVDVFQLFTSCW